MEGEGEGGMVGEGWWGRDGGGGRETEGREVEGEGRD